jgi:hypothetical protein
MLKLPLYYGIYNMYHMQVNPSKMHPYSNKVCGQKLYPTHDILWKTSLQWGMCHEFQCRQLYPSLSTHILNNIKPYKYNASYPNQSYVHSHKNKNYYLTQLQNSSNMHLTNQNINFLAKQIQHTTQ